MELPVLLEAPYKYSMEFVPTPKVKNVCEAWLHIEDTGNIIVPSQKVMKKLLK